MSKLGTIADEEAWNKQHGYSDSGAQTAVANRISTNSQLISIGAGAIGASLAYYMQYSTLVSLLFGGATGYGIWQFTKPKLQIGE